MIMTKQEFGELFLRALSAAARNVEDRLARPISHSFLIELHAPGSSGTHVKVEEALDRMYLGSDLYYKIIDVTIKELSPQQSIAFVRVSGHQPVPFDKTWDPSGTGPFKQVLNPSLESRPT
jgi:hypothetical protein